MGMSFIGSYSGIDQNTIDKLMQAERMPLKQLENKKVDITGKRDAWKDINTRLNSLAEKLNALKKASTFNSKIAKSSDDKYVSMNVGSSAAEGKYSIKVKELASNSSLVGKKVDIDITVDGKTVSAGINDELGLKDGRNFKIKNADGVERTINISENDSLSKIVENINTASKDEKDTEGKVIKSGTGITATIVDGRIVLNDKETGSRDIKLIGDGKGTLIDLGLNVTEQVDEDGAGIKLGNVAEFTLNGITIKSDSNTVKNAIDGTVITLNQKHTGEESDTITVSSDTEKAAKAMQDFVDQYNSTMQFIEEKTVAGDPKIPGSKGVLAGEGSLVRLQQSLRQSVSSMLKIDPKDGGTHISLGINTEDKSGVLKFDQDTFLEALKDNGDRVTKFLDTEETGFVDNANKFIDQFISKKDGFIKSQNDSFDKSLKDLSTRIENFEARMVKKEAYYVKTFTALDLAMMKAEDQMGWLQGQVDSMNGVKR